MWSALVSSLLRATLECIFSHKPDAIKPRRGARWCLKKGANRTNFLYDLAVVSVVSPSSHEPQAELSLENATWNSSDVSSVALRTVLVRTDAAAVGSSTCPRAAHPRERMAPARRIHPQPPVVQHEVSPILWTTDRPE